ncbi:flagellar biosynthetic protein FliR [Maritalea porphyrae]|jgi:flagellar biosynthetic protein FliR|uniref:flagellar biosynthetic protein FliR n=1 Tax=Maritalea porphyrae TaxID=880732 RepID=UPI0022AF4646|nr:flagellar biosynthetic protein FliR [Maritalea porphyrae]MCZ4272718.1 flagellar biosynthetic protein FliR [Maritalea porphyrae]
MSIDWLPQTALIYILIFARLGTLIMLMPGFSSQRLPMRMRLTLALVFTFIMYPLISQYYPTQTVTFYPAIFLLLSEIGVGLIIGGVTRILMSAAQVAGTVIAFQTGLSFAQTADPTQGGVQGAIFGNFIAVLGVTMVFTLDLHHLVLAAIYNSYSLFLPGAALDLRDAADMAIEVIAGSFVVGVQMSAPFIVFGLVFYFGLGLLARLMPQLQVFFIAMPANIAIGLLLFVLLLTMIMTWYMNHIEQFLLRMIG